jgi:sulfoxide reductase heme-binding subunit YedZ
MKRRMGGKRWQALHRLIYPAAIAGVIHYWWLVKADVTDPRFYAVVAGVLLVFRIWWWARSRAATPLRATRRRSSATPASAD